MLTVGDAGYIAPPETVFVEYENTTINASVAKEGRYKNIGFVNNVEMCCNSNDYFKLVPANDPLIQLPLDTLGMQVTLNQPFVNYTALTAVFVNVDGSSTLVTQQMLASYNVTFAIVGDNSCNATLNGKDIVKVQQRGNVSVQMSLVGYSDNTYTKLIRLQSAPVTLQAAETQSMHLRAHPLWKTSIDTNQEPSQIPGALMVRSIHCSDRLYEMFQITVHLKDSWGVMHWVHKTAYNDIEKYKLTFGFDPLFSLQGLENSMKQSIKDASVFYGVSTGASKIQVLWDNGALFAAHLPVEVTSMNPLMLHANSMHGVGISDPMLVGPVNYVANTNTSNLIFAKFQVAGEEGLIAPDPGTFSNGVLDTRQWMQHHAKPWILGQELLHLTSMASNKIGIDLQTNALVLAENTFQPVQVQARPKSSIGSCIFNSNLETESVSANVAIEGNIALSMDGDFDMGNTTGRILPTLNLNSMLSFVLPVYAQLHASNHTTSLKAIDIAILFDSLRLKAVACNPGQDSPAYFVCNILSAAPNVNQTGSWIGSVRIVALDAMSNISGSYLHIASITFQATGYAAGWAFLRGRRYTFHTFPAGSIPCSTGLEQQNEASHPRNPVRRAYCPFVAGGGELYVLIQSNSLVGNNNASSLGNNNGNNNGDRRNFLAAEAAAATADEQTLLKKTFAQSFRQFRNLHKRKEKEFMYKGIMSKKEMIRKLAFSMQKSQTFQSRRWLSRKLLQIQTVQSQQVSQSSSSIHASSFLLSSFNLSSFIWLAPNYNQSMAFLFPRLGAMSGDVPGDVNQDADFDALDVLMSQEYHLAPASTSSASSALYLGQLSMSTAGSGNVPSIPKNALPTRYIQHLFPIGSRNPEREFKHSLHVLAEKQVFVTQVNFTAFGQDGLKLGVKLDSSVSFGMKITFVFNTWQWWLFHKMLDTSTTNMFYDQENSLLFVEATAQKQNTSAVKDCCWWWIEAPSTYELPLFPLSVEYKIAWHHAQNFVSENNIDIAFVIETDVPTTDMSQQSTLSGTTWNNALLFQNANMSTDPLKLAKYIDINTTTWSTKQIRKISEPYASMNLSTMHVCYAYMQTKNTTRQNASLFSSSSSSLSVLWLVDTNALQQQGQQQQPLPMVYIQNALLGKEEFYELQLNMTLQIILPQSKDAQQIAKFFAKYGLYWDTWIFLPFQCMFVENSSDSNNNSLSPPLVLLSTTNGSLQNTTLTKYNTVEVNISLIVGLRTSGYEDANSLLNIIANQPLYGQRWISRMQYGLSTLFQGASMLQNASLYLFIHNFQIVHYVPLDYTSTSSSGTAQQPNLAAEKTTTNKYLTIFNVSMMMEQTQSPVSLSPSPPAPQPPSFSSANCLQPVGTICWAKWWTMGIGLLLLLGLCV